MQIRAKLRKRIPLSNNRSNNRRRGRGNNRSQGGNQLNRIDSRARGNAPQLLEKYKKLAHDASMNGDRVQAEYYLQFADHYFRVIADTKAQKDEARAKRDAERERSGDDDGDEMDDASPRRSRTHRSRDEMDSSGDESDFERDEGDSDSDEPENPFTRETRAKPKRAPRKTKAKAAADADDGDASGLDPSALPPSIARDSDDAEQEKPKKPRRPRKTRSSGTDDEALEAVG